MTDKLTMTEKLAVTAIAVALAVIVAAFSIVLYGLASVTRDQDRLPSFATDAHRPAVTTDVSTSNP